MKSPPFSLQEAAYIAKADPRTERFTKAAKMTRHHEGPSPVLNIRFPNDERLGRGKIRLLELIRETGSISAAARAMDMSYRRAWLLVSELNAMFCEAAVESQRGGQKGGGANITPFGEALLQRFRHMEALVESSLADDLLWLEDRQSQNGRAGI